MGVAILSPWGELEKVSNTYKCDGATVRHCDGCSLVFLYLCPLSPFCLGSDILLSARCHHFNDPFILIVYMICYSIWQRFAFAIPKCFSHVFSHEPRLTVSL